MSPFISRFTPNQMTPELLESLLVQRHGLATDLVSRIRESALTGHKHHQLLIGPRGIGKSHLLSVVLNRIGADHDLDDRLRIARLHEEETTTSFLDLLLRLYRALQRKYADEYPAEDLAPAFQLEATDATEFLTNLLLEKLAGRTLLIGVENLGDLFLGLGDEGQKRWRSLLQEHPRFTILATSQRLFADVSQRDAPFFGFFQIEYLRPLSIQDGVTLTRKVATLNGNTELDQFIDTPTGQARVQALAHLCDGNPRIYVTFAQFIDRDSLDDFEAPFFRTLDAMLPSYQSRVRLLSPQQRKIVERLAARPTTVAVRELARSLFMSQQTASSQLKDLKDKGHVIRHSRGRESLYELSDPMMRLCLAAKHGQRASVRSLVGLLKAWYSPEVVVDGIEDVLALDARKPRDARSFLVRLVQNLPDPVAEERLRLLIHVYREATALPHLAKELVRSLATLEPERSVPGALEEWIQLWEREYSVEELQVALRIFAVGARSLLSEDPRARLDLVIEERRLADVTLL